MTDSAGPLLDDRHALPHTVGLRGGRVTASVTPWGDVHPGDGSRALEWHVADEDRWHSPRVEPSIRQTRHDGTPVIETRLRVRGGDVVQRVWVVADHGGMLVAEFENDSPSSVAVALTRGDVITQRPPTSQPVLGIELPTETVVVPIGHRATVRVALPLEDSARNVAGSGLAALPGPDTVARGWLQAVESTARLVANAEPVDDLAAAVVDARCALLLGDVADPHEDPMGTLLDGIELVRMGERAALWMDELVPLAEECFARHREHSFVDLAQASVGMQDLLIRAGEVRGARDVAALWKKIDISTGRDGVGSSSVAVSLTQGRRIAAIEQQFCSVGADGSVVLMPAGLADSWRGINFECYGLMAGGGARVSYALRWHGENAAIMWEVTDSDFVLRSGADPSWSVSSTTETPSGEALWRLAVK